MSLNNLGLGFVFTAQDLASGVMGRVKNSFMELEGKSKALVKGFTQNFKQFTQGIAVFGAGVLMLSKSFALADDAGQFLQMIDQAGARAGATAGELAQLRKAAVDVGLQGAGASAQDAAEALRELAQEGYSTNDAIKALQPTLDLVAISFGDLSKSQAAGLVNDTLGEFKMQAAEAGPLVDKLALSMRNYGIRAGELEPALRGVATGVSLTGASLDDTLIALGLTKTVLPSVEQAARSVNLAFNQLANTKTRKELKAIGVTVSDSTGKMRPLLEILQSLNDKTSKMTEAQREHALATAFGARAGGGLTAIMQALSTGVRDSTGRVLKGADAIAELRRQMGAATGTAGAMKARMLDTFEGQKKALQASVSTFKTLIGEPFAQVLTPVLRVIRHIFDALNRAIASMPGPLKRILATVVLVIGAFLTVGGALLAAKAAFALVSMAAGALGISFGGIVAALLPVILVMAAVGLAALAFKHAFEENFGGIADAVMGAYHKIKLVWQGLVQLFTSGEFSGAVMTEIDKAENSGVKAFVIRLYMLWARLKAFGQGIADGFMEVIEPLKPLFSATVVAVQYLFDAIGRLMSAIFGTNKSAKGSQSTWHQVGRIIGWVAGVVGMVLVAALNTVILIIGGVVDALTWMGNALGYIAAGWYLLALKIGHYASVIYNWVAGKLVGAWNFMGNVAGAIWGAIKTAIDAVIHAIEVVIEKLLWAYNKAKSVGSFIFGSAVPDMSKYIAQVEGSNQAVQMVKAQGEIATAKVAARAAATAPAAAEAAGHADNARVIAASAGAPVAAGKPGDIVTHTVVNIDGEKIQEALQRTQRRDQVRNFGATPATE